MKKLSFIPAVMGMMYAYNVFADKVPSPTGCEEGEEFNCQVWQATPNGAGMILEKGYNSYSIIN